MTNVTFTHNVSGGGGAIYNSTSNGAAVVTIAKSTFADNSSVGSGNPLYNVGGSVSVINSTFTRNNSTRGGIIFNQYGSLTVINSTVAGNSSGGAGQSTIWVGR